MKILIVETSPIGTNDVTVHARNSVILNDYLNVKHECRLVWDDIGIPDLNEQFDYIIYVSATFYFKYDRFLQLMRNQTNCKIGWITNEYELFQQNFLKQYGTDFIISNFEPHGIKKAHKHSKYLMTNLNVLQAKPRNIYTSKEYDMCYYGTWRKYREVYFKKYLKNDMILSTSGKNIKKFQLTGCDCLLTDKFIWKSGEETLNQFKSTLYIEDTKTHECYNHLANRFYEGLYCNCSVFFDKSCLNTIKRSGYVINDFFIIDGYDEFKNKVQNIDLNLLEQFLCLNTNIALIEKVETLVQIDDFLTNY